MSSETLGFRFALRGGNFPKWAMVTRERRPVWRRSWFTLRSLSTRVGSTEIPRCFSSLPLFFTSGRFATFFSTAMRLASQSTSAKGLL